ncbi:flagellar basal body-associated FliL family protein [Nocardioides marmorisolisilvae]|uniref:Flagellar protein FliL n=1 Tax=Nocardioides marmorisolisilvae TaxID=1542737 RepID=A0A3N0DXA5_9ACTN|nr:flagellar basal body-associated FliL family protein [Nocardioides marmorisolisilvae]RNL80250.1 flagellar basal body-associated protein FliL [Nocardioides marmorisolisilvae]
MTVTAMPTAPEATEDKSKKKAGKDGEKAKGGKKKLIMMIVGALVLGGGGYVMFLKPKGPPGPPVAGDVVKLDAIQINLADDHYLRIAIGLQLVKGVKETDTSKAADATIGVFSGLPMSEVNDPKHRELLRKELVKELKERYEGEVMGVYFTELVTQ